MISGEVKDLIWYMSSRISDVPKMQDLREITMLLLKI